MTVKSSVRVFDRDQFRSNLLPYTQKAFAMLPPLKRPGILDVGCGSGITTVELAGLSGGDVVGLDINKEALDKLARKAAAAKLGDRITTLCVSMHEMIFPPENFNIIWTEGAISFIGLERALKEWRSLLIPKGFLVVHDRLAIMKPGTEATAKCGYSILGQFEVSQEAWWTSYYMPLKKYVQELRVVGPGNDVFDRELEKAEKEIADFKPDSDLYGSEFILFQKTD